MVAAASASESLKTYKFRVFTGPVDVREVASRLRSDGIDAHDGTEHVWGKVQAPSRLGAIDRVNAAARFPLAGWNDFRLDETHNERAHTEEEAGDPSAMEEAPGATEEDRRPVRKEETYLGYLLETEGLHSDKNRTETKYSYTTHGPGGRHSSGFIFYSRAEAQAAGRGRLIEEHHKNMDTKNDGAREAVTTHSGAITWHLDGDVYRGQGRLGSYTVEPAHKRGKKGGGWVALRGTKLLGWGEFHDDAIRMADAHDERAPEAPVRVVVHEVGETFDYDEHWKKDEAARAGILSEWHTDKKFQLPSEYNLQHLHWEHTLWRVERRLWGDDREKAHAHEHPDVFAVDASTEQEARAAVRRWTDWKFVGDWHDELTVQRWPIHNGRPVPLTWPELDFDFDKAKRRPQTGARERREAWPESERPAASAASEAAEAGPGGALEWRERGDVWTARWAGADYRIEPDGSDLVVTYAGRRIGRAGTLGAAMGMATRHTNEASGYRDPMAAENVPVVHEIVTGEVREEGDPLQPAPYSKKNLWEKDGGTMLQPYKGGWIVEVRGTFMGSVKKLKSGWKIDPLGKTTSGMAYEACKRATELLDAHFAHHSSATEASAPHEAGLAQDFGSPDAAVQHAGGNGATHYATRGSKTYVFWPAFGGRYVEKRVYASHGKWHIDKDYDGVAKLPKGAKKIDVPYETSASEKVSVLHEGPVSTAAEAAASEQREAVTIEHPAAKDICIPWVKVERDPERYATCLATARKIGPIDSPKKMYELLAGTMNKEDTEIFVVVLCDVRGQLRGVCEVARGQRSKVSVGVNDVLRVVLVSGAELFMCAHLHPTGSSPSSKSDKDLTRDIEEACKPFKSEITFADHVVIGMGEVTSIKEGKTYPMNQRAAHRKGKPYMPALAAKPD